MKNPSREALSQNDDVLPPLDDPFSHLPPEAIFERLSNGGAGRQKLERELSRELASSFYFFRGELVGDHRKGRVPMRLTGCEFRQAKSGPRAGRWVMPVPGTNKTVIVTPAEVDAFEKTEVGMRLSELRRLRKLRGAHASTGAVEA